MTTAGLDDLYREILLDHYRSPRNRGHLAGANAQADGANPLCGDQITVELLVDDDGRVANIAFEGSGCSISQASSSMMTGYVKGRTADEALAGVEAFQRMMVDASRSTSSSATSRRWPGSASSPSASSAPRSRGRRWSRRSARAAMVPGSMVRDRAARPQCPSRPTRGAPAMPDATPSADAEPATPEAAPDATPANGDGRPSVEELRRCSAGSRTPSCA